MRTTIKGAPSFTYIEVELGPGESIIAESDAMASMDAGIDMKAVFNGGFFVGLLRKFLGGESLFVNIFTNPDAAPKRLVLVQKTPGDIKQIPLKGSALCLQPGAYVASTPGLNLGVRWAGFRSWLAGEGLFKLMVRGTGVLWFGAYGGILFREVEGAYLVDTSHIVAYEPQMKLRIQLAGGILSSFFGGEGLVTRMVGHGKIAIQTRSMAGLRDWLNPRLGG